MIQRATAERRFECGNDTVPQAVAQVSEVFVARVFAPVDAAAEEKLT